MHIGKYFGYIFHGAIRILFYPFKIRKYVKNKENFTIEERFDAAKEHLSDLMDNILRVKIETRGLEKLNKNDTYLFVPNHQSMLDAVALICLFDEHAVFVSKKEAKKMPIVNKFEHIIDAYFLDRESPRDALKMVKTCNQYLKNKTNVVIFAEGTRSKDENISIGEYKAGAFKCVYETGAKVVPVVIDKSYIPLSTKYKNTDKTIVVSFLDPILQEEYQPLSTSELSSKVNKLAIEELQNLRNENK